MATTYAYNSLNQLVTQDVPDNQRMDLWETSHNPLLLDDSTVTDAQYQNGRGIMLVNSPATGSFYLTDNNGETWKTRTNVAVPAIRKIQKNQNNAFAVGEDGLFMASTNGGLNWEVRQSPTSQTLVDLYFTSAQNGFVLTQNGQIFTTINGGFGWTQVAGVNLGTVKDSWFGSTAYRVLNTASQIFTSTDGTNWTQETLANVHFNGVDKSGTDNYILTGPAYSLYQTGLNDTYKLAEHHAITSSLAGYFTGNNGNRYVIDAVELNPSRDSISKLHKILIPSCFT